MFILRIATVIVSLTAAVLSAQTAWLSPVTVATNAGTSSSILLNPQLAAAANGDLSAVWTGHWGTNETTQMLTYTSARHSDVYAGHSTDSGNNWTSPTQISESRVLSTFARVIASDSGAFHYSYTSGDSFTGLRFHTVTTVDGGASYTSNTLLQNLLDLNEGFLHPKIVSAGSSLVAGWTGINSASFLDPLLARSSDGGATWNYTEVPDASLNLISSSVKAAPTIGSEGLDIVAPHTLSWMPDFTTPAIYASEVFLMTSRDGGETWRTHNRATSSTLDSFNPYVVSDGKGNWLMFWLGYSDGRMANSQLYLQKSTTGWEEWTTPTLVAAAPMDVKSATTDGDGRWLVLLRSTPLGEINYVWSDDDGETWSGIITIPGTKSSHESDSCAYIGNGQWGVVWADGASIKLTKMQWGESAVSDWVLY